MARPSKHRGWLSVMFLTASILASFSEAAGATSESASPTTLVLQPGPEGKDTGVYGLAPTTNYGAGEWFYGIGLPGYGAGLAQFDVSAVPPGALVTSATIALWAKYMDGQLTLSPLAESWDEMSATWVFQPAVASPSMDVTYPISRGAPTGPCWMGCVQSFDVTNIVQYWVDNPSLNRGLKIVGDTPGYGWLMASSDNLGSPRPLLTVEYDITAPSLATSWGSIKSRYR
jgi:hypothetical protein